MWPNAQLNCGFGHIYWKNPLMENFVFAQCIYRFKRALIKSEVETSQF